MARDRLDEILSDDYDPEVDAPDPDDDTDPMAPDDDLTPEADDDLSFLEKDPMEPDPEPEPEPEPKSEVDVNELQSKLETLEKERFGLLKAKQAETRKRQEMSGRLEQLTTTVNDILAQRQINAGPQEPKEPEIIPVNMTEDGDYYIRADQLPVKPDTQVQEVVQKVNKLDETLAAEQAYRAAEIEAERIRQSIVAEDVTYGNAYQTYQKARAWADAKALEFIKDNNVNRPLKSGEALEHVFTPDLEAEFTKEFPDVDLVSVVIAEDAPPLFRRAIKDISNKMTVQTQEPAPKPKDERFEKVLKKPSTLAQTPNSRAGELTVSEKLDNMSFNEIMNLDDKQAEALDKAMRQEELRDGIKFKR